LRGREGIDLIRENGFYFFIDCKKKFSFLVVFDLPLLAL